MLGVGIKNIEQGLKKIKPMPGRMQILNGINDSIIIDDTYNSSPIAVKEALNTLYEYKGTQKIAILGMMNELGDTSQVSHEWAGALCDPKKLDLLITLGKDANNYLAPVAAKKGCNVIKVNSPYEAGEILKKEIIHGSVILAKGSQNGVFAEEAIKPILASNADQSKLVRQSKFWLSKKKVQFNK
jgi:UDP-N-acetylmuramoyl-tripeptide--D-alanyl-D-alanine ligase